MEINNDIHEEIVASPASLDENDIDGIRKRVLNVPEIRRHVLSFLPLGSIKLCRLVCSEWNATAEELLLSLSNIRFCNNLDEPDEARLPDKFVEDFSAGSLLNKCNKFCFNSPESWIEYDDLSSFVQQFGDNMRELTIFETYIRNALYPLSKNDLINLIPTNLTKLEVVTERSKTKLIISMQRLRNIETLRLGGCILKIRDNVVCAPAELRLKNMFFLRNRKDFQKKVKLNDLFDFRNMNILHLDCSETANIQLDLSDGTVNLKTLVLDHVDMLNWETSTWNVKKLQLCKKTKFNTATGMKFKELEFSGPVLDMAVLPTTITHLSLLRYKTKIQHIELAQNLTNLKYLVVQRKEFTLLRNFQTCANLTHLHLYPIDEDDDYLATIDVSLFPNTVKVFRLNYTCEMINKIDFEIETVIFQHIPFSNAYEYLVENLRAKNAFLYCSNFHFETDDDIGIDEAVEELDLHSYVVGPFLRSKDTEFSFLYFPDANSKAELLTKRCKTGMVVKKEFFKTEIDRMINTWWTNDEFSF